MLFTKPLLAHMQSLNCKTASEKRNAMDDKFFAGLHEGLLVHRLYLMSGTEVLYTSPANWKVISIDDEFLELIDLTVQSSFPYMADHLVTFTGPHVTTKLRVRKAAVAGIEFVIDYPKNMQFG
jgi:hypothetical protein